MNTVELQEEKKPHSISHCASPGSWGACPVKFPEVGRTRDPAAESPDTLPDNMSGSRFVLQGEIWYSSKEEKMLKLKLKEEKVIWNLDEAAKAWVLKWKLSDKTVWKELWSFFQDVRERGLDCSHLNKDQQHVQTCRSGLTPSITHRPSTTEKLPDGDRVPPPTSFHKS